MSETNRQWLAPRPSRGHGAGERLRAARGARARAGGRSGAGAQPLARLRARDARLDRGRAELHAAGADRRRHARHGRRRGGRVEARRLRAGRSRDGHDRLAGVGGRRRRAPQAAAGQRPAPRALGARHHRDHGLLRAARGGPAPRGRRGGGLRRGRRDRLGRGPDRQAQGLPRDRHRGRPGQVSLADRDRALRRRDRLQARGRRRAPLGALPGRHRRVLRQRRRARPRRGARRASRAAPAS